MDKLSDKQIELFIEQGYVKIEAAFSAEIAAQCCSILWKAAQLNPDRPETWTQPVIRIGEIGLEPFKLAANTDILHQCFNQLAGDNWLPRVTLGTFPIRFPGTEPAGDTGGTLTQVLQLTIRIITLIGVLMSTQKDGPYLSYSCFQLLQIMMHRHLSGKVLILMLQNCLHSKVKMVYRLLNWHKS